MSNMKQTTMLQFDVSSQIGRIFYTLAKPSSASLDFVVTFLHQKLKLPPIVAGTRSPLEGLRVWELVDNGEVELEDESDWATFAYKAALENAPPKFFFRVLLPASYLDFSSSSIADSTTTKVASTMPSGILPDSQTPSTAPSPSTTQLQSSSSSKPKSLKRPRSDSDTSKDVEIRERKRRKNKRHSAVVLPQPSAVTDNAPPVTALASASSVKEGFFEKSTAQLAAEASKRQAKLARREEKRARKKPKSIRSAASSATSSPPPQPQPQPDSVKLASRFYTKTAAQILAEGLAAIPKVMGSKKSKNSRRKSNEPKILEGQSEELEEKKRKRNRKSMNGVIVPSPLGQSSLLVAAGPKEDITKTPVITERENNDIEMSAEPEVAAALTAEKPPVAILHSPTVQAPSPSSSKIVVQPAPSSRSNRTPSPSLATFPSQSFVPSPSQPPSNILRDLQIPHNTALGSLDEPPSASEEMRSVKWPESTAEQNGIPGSQHSLVVDQEEDQSEMEETEEESLEKTADQDEEEEIISKSQLAAIRGNIDSLDEDEVNEDENEAPAPRTAPSAVKSSASVFVDNVKGKEISTPVGSAGGNDDSDSEDDEDEDDEESSLARDQFSSPSRSPSPHSRRKHVQPEYDSDNEDFALGNSSLYPPGVAESDSEDFDHSDSGRRDSDDLAIVNGTLPPSHFSGEDFTSSLSENGEEEEPQHQQYLVSTGVESPEVLSIHSLLNGDAVQPTEHEAHEDVEMAPVPEMPVDIIEDSDEENNEAHMGKDGSNTRPSSPIPSSSIRSSSNEVVDKASALEGQKVVEEEDVMELPEDINDNASDDSCEEILPQKSIPPSSVVEESDGESEGEDQREAVHPNADQTIREGTQEEITQETVQTSSFDAPLEAETVPAINQIQLEAEASVIAPRDSDGSPSTAIVVAVDNLAPPPAPVEPPKRKRGRPPLTEAQKAARGSKKLKSSQPPPSTPPPELETKSSTGSHSKLSEQPEVAEAGLEPQPVSSPAPPATSSVELVKPYKVQSSQSIDDGPSNGIVLVQNSQNIPQEVQANTLVHIQDLVDTQDESQQSHPFVTPTGGSVRSAAVPLPPREVAPRLSTSKPRPSITTRLSEINVDLLQSAQNQTPKKRIVDTLRSFVPGFKRREQVGMSPDGAFDTDDDDSEDSDDSDDDDDSEEDTDARQSNHKKAGSTLTKQRRKKKSLGQGLERAIGGMKTSQTPQGRKRL